MGAATFGGALPGAGSSGGLARGLRPGGGPGAGAGPGGAGTKGRGGLAVAPAPASPPLLPRTPAVAGKGALRPRARPPPLPSTPPLSGAPSPPGCARSYRRGAGEPRVCTGGVAVALTPGDLRTAGGAGNPGAPRGAGRGATVKSWVAPPGASPRWSARPWGAGGRGATGRRGVPDDGPGGAGASWERAKQCVLTGVPRRQWPGPSARAGGGRPGRGRGLAAPQTGAPTPASPPGAPRPVPGHPGLLPIPEQTVHRAAFPGCV